MRIQATFTRSLLVFVLGGSAVVVAQPDPGPPCAGPGRGGRGGGDPQGRLFDPKTVEDLSGEILSLDRIAGRRGMGGIHAKVKSDKGETIVVHLGPAWFLDQQALTFQQGDRVTVRGSRITFDDKPAIIAAEITKDGQTLRLRDPQGIPVWAGGRRRGR
jgi:hypothetical protein